MAESWGDEDETIDEWGTEDETVTSPTAQTTQTPAPTEQEEESSILEDVVGAGETVAALATSAGAEVMGGLRGLGTTLGAEAAELIHGETGVSSVDKGVEELRRTQSALTYNPRTDRGQEIMGNLGEALAPVADAYSTVESTLGEAGMAISPEVATALHTLPTAALEVFGLGMLRRPSKAAQQAKDMRADIDDQIMQGTDVNEAVANAVEKVAVQDGQRDFDAIIESMRQGDQKTLANDVMPDEQIQEAARLLGVDLDPSHYSTNEAFIRVVQALKSKPNNPLEAKEYKLMRELGERADKLIEDSGGFTDRGVLTEEVRRSMDNTLTDLTERSDEMFRVVEKKIPPRTRILAESTQNYIDRRIAELGDNAALLAPVERKILQLVKGGKEITYNALDTLRKEIGEGYKRKGEFMDTPTATLDQVYSVLADDQGRAAQAFGVGDEYGLGNNLIIKRKALEKNMEAIFGRDLSATNFLSKLSTATNRLSKGDVNSFKDMMKKLPPQLRQQAASTMMHDLFILGRRNKGDSFGYGFATAYDALDRNPSVKKELFRYIPKEQQRIFDAMGKVSQGVSRAKLFENNSRTSNAILAALESGSMINQIMERGMEGSARVAGWKTMGHFGAASIDNLMKSMKDSEKYTKRATDLMNSPQFNAALNKAMEGKVKQAEMMLKRSDAWRKFREVVGEGTREQLRIQGPIAWLTQAPETGQEQEQQTPDGQ